MIGQSDLKAYLFATQAVLAEETIHGSGTYDPTNPTSVLSSAVTDRLTVHDGWSLKSWANPNGILSTTSGIPETAVALRTRTWTGGFSNSPLNLQPTKITIASAFDGWGPTRTDEYTENPSSNAVAGSAPSLTSLGGDIRAVGDIAPPSISDGIVRTGVITRHGDGLPNPLCPTAEAFSGTQGLMEILTDTDHKYLGGGQLTSLRGTGSADFGTTLYSYDSLGRISAQKGTRGSFVATESPKTYATDLAGLPQPLLADTTKSLTGPNGTIPANPATPVAVGDSYTYTQDPHIQSGPTTHVGKVDGRAESFVYDALGRVTQHTDVLHEVTDTAYDDWGRVASVKRTSADGSMWTAVAYQYDRNGTWKRETASSSDSTVAITTTTTYDALGHVTNVQTLDASYQNGTTQSFTYDGFGQKLTATPVLVIHNGVTQGWAGTESWLYDAIGQVTDNYDAQGRQTLHVVQQPKWGVLGTKSGVVTISQNDWDLRNGTQRSELVDLLGQKGALLDQGGKLSTYTYDQDGHLTMTTQTDPANGKTQTRSYTYNDMGWLTSRTEPEEGTTWYSTDPLTGQPLKGADGFNMLGTPLKTIQTGRSGGHNATFSTILDAHLQPTSIVATDATSAGTISRTLTYDPATYLLTTLSETQPYGTLTETYAYDSFFRLNNKTVGDGHEIFRVMQSLDAAGRQTSLTYPTPAGRADKVVNGFDGLGRVVTVTLNGETQYTGSLIPDQVSASSSAVVDTVVLGNGSQTTSTVDKGELTHVTHTALSGVLEDDALTWSAGGLLLTRQAVNLPGSGTNPRAVFNDTYVYDPLQRLSTATVRNPQDNSTVTQTFGYDGFGNRIASTAAYSGAVPPDKQALTWNVVPDGTNDLPATLTAAGGNLATGALYDDLGRLTQVWTTPNQPTTLTTWVYDPSGRVLKENGAKYILDSSGLRFCRMEADGRVDYTVYGFGKEPLANYERQLGDAHTGAHAVQIFHNDTTNSSLSHVLGIFSAGDTVTASVWAKAPAGAPIQVFLGDVNTYDGKAYSNSVGKVVTATGQWQQITLSHTMSTTDQMWVYLYGDTNNHSYENGVTTSFDDVLATSTQQGTILSEGFESGISAWGSSGQLNVLLTDGSLGPLEWRKTMVYGFGQLLREEDFVQGTIYDQSDQVGSPNFLTNPAGAVVGGAKTLPFGEPLYQWGDTSNRRYTNHERDADSNAIYMQAREYLPAYGKFAEVDPAYDQTKDDPESWNLYNYVTNNPVTHTDPDGREAKGYGTDPHGKKFKEKFTDEEAKTLKNGGTVTKNGKTYRLRGAQGKSGGQQNKGPNPGAHYYPGARGDLRLMQDQLRDTGHSQAEIDDATASYTKTSGYVLSGSAVFAVTLFGGEFGLPVLRSALAALAAKETSDPNTANEIVTMVEDLGPQADKAQQVSEIVQKLGPDAGEAWKVVGKNPEQLQLAKDVNNMIKAGTELRAPAGLTLDTAQRAVYAAQNGIALAKTDAARTLQQTRLDGWLQLVNQLRGN